MNKINLLYLFLICLTLINCGKNRIELITKNSSLTLPYDYKILKNKSINSGISDFEINIILKFDKNNFQKLSQQIDSLSKINPNWKSKNQEYFYSNYSNQNEPETIKVNKQNRTLEFVFTHI